MLAVTLSGNAKYVAGESIVFKGTYANVSDESLVLTFWWNRFIKVRDAQSGEIIAPGAGPKLPCGVGEDECVIAAKSSVEREEYLGCTQPHGAEELIGWSYDLRPGSYIATLVFEYPRCNYGKSRNSSHFTGRAESNEFQFQVEEDATQKNKQGELLARSTSCAETFVKISLSFCVNSLIFTLSLLVSIWLMFM
jgi:hypothetical protein